MNEFATLDAQNEVASLAQVGCNEGADCGGETLERIASQSWDMGQPLSHSEFILDNMTRPMDARESWNAFQVRKHREAIQASIAEAIAPAIAQAQKAFELTLPGAVAKLDEGDGKAKTDAPPISSIPELAGFDWNSPSANLPRKQLAGCQD